MVMSSAVTTTTGTMTGRRPPKARVLNASGTRNSAPSKVRPNTTTDGGKIGRAHV